jgi:hypothetical protein
MASKYRERVPDQILQSHFYPYGGTTSMGFFCETEFEAK